MKIVVAYPPNIEEIKKKVTINKFTIFTYGNKIYNPGNWPLLDTPDIFAHEEVHTKQQGNAPRLWWRRYLDDMEFRLAQELEAYRVQYQYVLKNMPNEENSLLNKFAKDLSSSMYGNIIPWHEAKKKIRE